MDRFLEPVAKSTSLQAIAILVAVGTLAYYTIKYAALAWRLIRDILARKYRQALLSVFRPAIRRARYDYKDIRLINISISLNHLKILISFFQLSYVLFGISLIRKLFNFKELPNTVDIYAVISVILGMVTGLSISLFLSYGIIRPFMLHLTYLRSVRRYIRREKLLGTV